MILGHAHPAVVEAVTERVRLGSTFYFPSDATVELAELMVERIPCAEMIQFCTSGAEATHYALRFARAATGRDAALKFEGGFHGPNDYSIMSLYASGTVPFPEPEPASGGVPRALRDEVLVAPYNDLERTAAIVAANAHRLAGILVEPYQRTIDPLPGFLEGLRAVVRQLGLVPFFDDVVAGLRIPPRVDEE